MTKKLPSTPPELHIPMPTYNAARFIADSMKSVLGQDYLAAKLIQYEKTLNDLIKAHASGFDVGVRETYRKMAVQFKKQQITFVQNNL